MTDVQTTHNLWTPHELRAATATYLDMLACELNGKPYSKADYRRALLVGPLSTRTAASIELRMQNISAVLSALGRPWITGYKPAKNVGSGVQQQIVAILGEVSEDTPPALLPLPSPPSAPVGRVKPGQKQVTSTSYQRDAAVVAWVLHRANGICECCGQPAPFIDKNGAPFLEVHHVSPLSEGGEDTPANTAAICPNCHREAHYGERADEVWKRLGCLNWRHGRPRAGVI